MKIVQRRVALDCNYYDLAMLHFITDTFRVQFQLGRESHGQWIPHTIITDPFPDIKARQNEMDTVVIKCPNLPLAERLGIIPHAAVGLCSSLRIAPVVVRMTPEFISEASYYLKELLANPHDPTIYD